MLVLAIYLILVGLGAFVSLGHLAVAIAVLALAAAIDDPAEMALQTCSMIEVSRPNSG
jgi:hypothetical protein